MKQAVIVLAIFAVTASCETTFTPDLPDNGSGLVVYSFFRPDDPLRFDVFSTTPIMQQGKLSRKADLKFRLIKNGAFAEEVTANAQGVYVTTEIPTTGDHYAFESVGDATMLFASNYLQQSSKIMSGDVSDELHDIDVAKYGYPTQITLKDPPDSVNYFAFEVLIDDCNAGCSELNLDGVVNPLLIE